jgi:hypothetical protein
VSNHFPTKNIEADRVRKVLRVDEFADVHGLDEKQKHELLQLFGQFATLHELLTNCQLPGRIR